MRNRLVQPQWLAAVALFTLSIGVHGHEPPSDLLAHLPMDGSLADASGNGFEGEGLAGVGERRPPRYVEGKFGRAVQLDGDTAVLIPLDLDFERYPEVTITGWVFVENDDARGALFGTGGGDGPEMRLNGDSLIAVRPGGGREVAHSALRPGRWTFFAGTWNYRDGTMRVTRGSRSSSTSFAVNDLDAPGQDVVIGAQNYRMNLAGNATRIDDVRIYGRSLDEAELARLRTDESGDVRLAGAGDEQSRPSSEPTPQIAQEEPPPGATLDRDDFGASDELVTDLETAGEQPLATIGDEGAGEIEEFGAEDYTPSSEPDHVVVIDGAGKAGRTRYTLTVAGEIEKAEGRILGIDATINDNDVIQGNTANGVVGEAADAYYVYGDVANISLEDYEAATVYVDGVELKHRVVFDGSAGDGRTNYTLATSGMIRKASGSVDGFDATINDNDVIEGRNASGIVGSAVDAYYVFGSVIDIAIDNPDAVTVYLDGKPLAADETDDGLLTIGQSLEPQTGSGSANGLYLPIADEEPTLSEISNARGTSRLTLDLVYSAMHTITWYEESDRPCDFRILGYGRGLTDIGAPRTATASEEVCNGSAGNPGSKKVVSLAARHGVAQTLSACRNEPPSIGIGLPQDRIKGIGLSGRLIDTDTMTLSRDTWQAKATRPNCSGDWDTVTCPDERVATGLILHVKLQSNGNYLVGGLQLICRRITDQ
ncbi:LamG-like jellyroll fold domain-containing protein [Lentisalinibacter salinarum]|uniref:LamG-like jellyroll fold domain-containing protein n=1 Tax=Lentisalinibacter salinarum TaxID=2992239 RepID=UPI003870ECC3